MIDPRKVLLISGCSEEKLPNAAPAKYLYQGVLFKKVKKLVDYKKFDFKILSAKYGLIDADQIIEPYDKTIITKKDVEELREEVCPKLKFIQSDYSLIILVMGQKYREVLEPLFDDNKYKMIYDPKGIGNIIAKVNKYLNNPLNVMIKELSSCKVG